MSAMDEISSEDVQADDTFTFSDSAEVASIAKLWILWARSARTRTDEAAAARAEMVAAQQGGNSAEVSRLLDVESGAALVAVCSAVFAVESISIVLREHIVDQATRDSWSKNKSNAARVLGQILQRSIASRSSADDLAARWAPLYESRDKSVHYPEAMSSLVDHPIGTRTDPVHVEFSADNAQEAISALVDTLRSLRDDPKGRARRWASLHLDAIEEFVN